MRRPWPPEILGLFNDRWDSDNRSPKYDKDLWVRLRDLLEPFLTGVHFLSRDDSLIEDYRETLTELREEHNVLLATRTRLKTVLMQMEKAHGEALVDARLAIKRLESEGALKDFRIAQLETDLANARLKYTMDAGDRT